MKMLQKDRMAGEGGYAEDFQGLDNAVATQGKQSKPRQLYRVVFFNSPPPPKKKVKVCKT